MRERALQPFYRECAPDAVTLTRFTPSLPPPRGHRHALLRRGPNPPMTCERSASEIERRSCRRKKLEEGNTTLNGNQALLPVKLYFHALPHPPSSSSDASNTLNQSAPTSTDTSPIPTPSKDPSSPGESLSFSQFTESAKAAKRHPPLASEFQQDLDEHVILTAAFHGWGAVQRQVDLGPQWGIWEFAEPILRRFCLPAEVIAILRLIRKSVTVSRMTLASKESHYA